MISPNLYDHFTENLDGVIYDGIWVGPNSKIPTSMEFAGTPRRDADDQGSGGAFSRRMFRRQLRLARWCWAGRDNGRDGRTSGAEGKRPVAGGSDTIQTSSAPTSSRISASALEASRILRRTCGACPRKSSTTGSNIAILRRAARPLRMRAPKTDTRSRSTCATGEWGTNPGVVGELYPGGICRGVLGIFDRRAGVQRRRPDPSLGLARMLTTGPGRADFSRRSPATGTADCDALGFGAALLYLEPEPRQHPLRG